jgi:hypothetical protein
VALVGAVLAFVLDFVDDFLIWFPLFVGGSVLGILASLERRFLRGRRP